MFLVDVYCIIIHGDFDQISVQFIYGKVGKLLSQCMKRYSVSSRVHLNTALHKYSYVTSYT